MSVSIFEAIGAMAQLSKEIESSEGYENCLIVQEYLKQQKDKL